MWTGLLLSLVAWRLRHDLSIEPRADHGSDQTCGLPQLCGDDNYAESMTSMDALGDFLTSIGST
ncbi:hypothetical protein At1D1609_51280 (plasmid) [Agrobacterium tumefaciens]|uniref:Uncharacterized protein n=1 Tax=Agrobacterium tumefaciens TaxID=358 RepID=A0A2L2LLF7_AGRTU|nr:hypothetical protein At1D1609_51280 [Agrobacterium tumefaciens]